MGALPDRHVTSYFAMCHLRRHVLREAALAEVTKKFCFLPRAPKK
jgi:hypothetical protein